MPASKAFLPGNRHGGSNPSLSANLFRAAPCGSFSFVALRRIPPWLQRGRLQANCEGCPTGQRGSASRMDSPAPATEIDHSLSARPVVPA